MNKIYFLFMLLLALFFTSAQSLKVEYEVQFKSKDTPELTGSSDFQNKIKSLIDAPQRHILSYSDGNSVYKSILPEVIYDSNKENDFDDEIRKNIYERKQIKIFKLKNEKGAYGYHNLKNEEFYQYVIPHFDILQTLETTEKILGHICKIAEAEMGNKNKAKVWYTEQINIKTGPMAFYDFPGLVLKVETRNMSIIAKKVEKDVGNISLETLDKNIKVYEGEAFAEKMRQPTN
ncbi:GLPGLI family protein [Chryseobacterium indoltheticum]|uniref:GLPGLI family protein n=1 Tax=Chryseobacterium indoltheticum TaxID=254 RepID=UPI004042C57C